MERSLLILLHVLGATIWVGGHLILALSVLPRALRANDAAAIQQYEQSFERIGIPALVVQVLTGLRLAWIYHARWFDFSDHVGRHVSLKLIALLLTVALAAHARISLVPKLGTGSLKPLAWHIAAVTTLAVLLATLGVSFRVGNLF